MIAIHTEDDARHILTMFHHSATEAAEEGALDEFEIAQDFLSGVEAAHVEITRDDIADRVWIGAPR